MISVINVNLLLVFFCWVVNFQFSFCVLIFISWKEHTDSLICVFCWLFKNSIGNCISCLKYVFVFVKFVFYEKNSVFSLEKSPLPLPQHLVSKTLSAWNFVQDNTNTIDFKLCKNICTDANSSLVTSSYKWQYLWKPIFLVEVDVTKCSELLIRQIYLHGIWSKWGTFSNVFKI